MFEKTILSTLCTVFVVGCSTAQPIADSVTAASRYRVGDFVVYKYAGSFSPQAVVIREEVVAQEGNRLTILVEARRDTETRKWVQVVTDTPENQRAEKIDELYDLSGGGRIRLSNENNQDIYRLYEWTIPPLASRPSTVDNRSETIVFGNTSFACRVEIGRFGPDSQVREFHFSTCADFLWTNGPARVISSNNEVLWERQVVEFGRRR